MRAGPDLVVLGGCYPCLPQQNCQGLLTALRIDIACAASSLVKADVEMHRPINGQVTTPLSVFDLVRTLPNFMLAGWRKNELCFRAEPATEWLCERVCEKL